MPKEIVYDLIKYHKQANQSLISERLHIQGFYNKCYDKKRLTNLLFKLMEEKKIYAAISISKLSNVKVKSYSITKNEAYVLTYVLNSKVNGVAKYSKLNIKKSDYNLIRYQTLELGDSLPYVLTFNVDNNSKSISSEIQEYLGINLEYISYEEEVVKIFKKIKKKLGFKQILAEYKSVFPDFWVKDFKGNIKQVEIETSSSDFKNHVDNHQKCDYIVCWNKNREWNIPVITIKDFLTKEFENIKYAYKFLK